jgi:hypothetical protein
MIEKPILINVDQIDFGLARAIRAFSRKYEK